MTLLIIGQFQFFLFSKIIEKLMYNRLNMFLDKHGILYENQFGFRKNMSTSLALCSLVSEFQGAITRKEIMISIFIDLSRAFDTISHDILFAKLQHYGIRGNTLDWIKNYLTDRKQFVMYNGEKSPLGSLNIGVPQGSILGPLLFLLYVNDLCNASKKCSLIQYADDTTLSVSGTSMPDIFSTINGELPLIVEWLNNNKLSLNVSKTNYMVMSSRNKMHDSNNYTISINGCAIDRVHETKFLGIIIDDKLTWKSHIHLIENKVSKSIGILLRARKLLYTESLLILYNSLIKPYFTYCIIIWGNTYKTYVHKLYIQQKKIIRIIHFSGFNSHTDPLFRKLKVMNIEQLYRYFVGIFVYKSLNKLLPERFSNYFSKNVTSRNIDTLRPAISSSRVSEFFVGFTGPHVWNTLPESIRKSKSLNLFKLNIKTLLAIAK